MHHGVTDADSLELVAYKKVETISIVTRVAPMLGLVATMIPIGPALKSLSDGNVQGISETKEEDYTYLYFVLFILGLIGLGMLYKAKKKP